MFDKNALLGLTLMVIVAAFGAVDALVVRFVSDGIHPFVLGFTRALFGLLVMFPWIISRPNILRTNRYGLHFLRAALKLGSLVALFAAMANAPLATVTAIGFASPIFVTLGAWLFFGESRRPMRVLGIAIGFVGVLVLLNPSVGVPAISLFLALLSATLIATIQLMLKYMGASENTDTLVAWNLIATVPIAIVPAFLVWTSPTALEWVALVIQGVVGAGAQLLVTKAFQLADASLLAPVDFLRLPFVAVVAYLVFGEVAEMTTWIGSAIVFASILIMAVSLRNKSELQT